MAKSPITTRVISHPSAEAALKAILKDAGLRVLVGIPMATSERANNSDETPSNAVLGYLHEFGNPSTNLPARPFLVPGVQAILKQAAARLQAGGAAELRGQKGALLRAMNIVGLMAVNSVRSRIANGIPPPITERAKYSRLARRSSYQVASKARRKTMLAAYLNGTFTPLIDTGEMRNSITYVIRKK